MNNIALSVTRRVCELSFHKSTWKAGKDLQYELGHHHDRIGNVFSRTKRIIIDDRQKNENSILAYIQLYLSIEKHGCIS